MDPCDAMTALAEGSMQCAVTSDAFEMLLHMQETSLLETVMRSAAVFSRMQPRQKGHVMDLLGRRGIHQPYQGNSRHIQVGLSQHFQRAIASLLLVSYILLRCHFDVYSQAIDQSSARKTTLLVSEWSSLLLASQVVFGAVFAMLKASR